MTRDGAHAQVLAQSRPVGIVRDAPGKGTWGYAPYVFLGGGVLLAALLGAAALIVRKRSGRRTVRVNDPPVAGALPTLARAMRIGRAEVRALRRLAAAANMREPAVLLISEYAFRDAAARVLSAAPESAASVASLAASLGYRLDDGAGVAGENRGRTDDRTA